MFNRHCAILLEISNQHSQAQWLYSSVELRRQTSGRCKLATISIEFCYFNIHSSKKATVPSNMNSTPKVAHIALNRLGFVGFDRFLPREALSSSSSHFLSYRTAIYLNFGDTFYFVVHFYLCNLSPSFSELSSGKE